MIFIIVFQLYTVIISGLHPNSQTNLIAFSSQINTRNQVLSAQRGTIFDRNGDIIAQDVISYTLFAIVSPTRPSYQNRPAHVVDVQGTAEQLADLLQAPVDFIKERLMIASYQTEFGVYGRQLSVQQKEAIEALNLPGIGFIQNASRLYPLNQFAPYLIGFVNQEPNGNRTQLVGQMGVESIYDRFLAGTNGSRLAVVDRFGYELPGYPVRETPAINGAHLYLTLDRLIQEQLESSFLSTVELFKATEVFGAVMEANTGRILAVGQYPGFNPNVRDVANFQNALTQTLYEPGSTMKTFTYAAAIDAGVYQGDQTFNSNRFIVGLNAKGEAIRLSDPARSIGVIRNARNREWGMISYDTGYAYSANTGIAALMTTSLKPSVLQEYLTRFGFSNRVNIEGFSETLGQINFRFPIERLAVGYGQGLTVNMAQMLQAYTAIFNEGVLVRPYLVERLVDAYTQQDIKKTRPTILGQAIQPASAQKMIDLMALAVEDPRATGQHYRIDEVDIVAKTGTAQIAVGGNYVNDEFLYSVAIGLPRENPEIIIYYAFRAPATLNAHVFTDPVRKLILRTAIVMDYRKPNLETTTLNKHQDRITHYPNLINLSSAEAVQQLSEFNRVLLIGTGETVLRQHPSGNQWINNQQPIFLLTDDRNPTLPDLSGLLRKDVLAFFELLGRSPSLIGEGQVIAQSWAPGDRLNAIDELEVRFE
jgi:penicillin-binding protein 2B